MGLLIGLTSILGVGAVGLYLYVRTSLLGSMDTALEAKAGEVAASFDAEDDAPETEGPRLHPLETTERFFHYQIQDAAGRVVDRSPSLASNLLPEAPPSPDNPLFWNLILPDGHSGRAIRLRAGLSEDGTGNPSPAAAGGVSIVVARDLRDLESVLRTLRVGLGGGLLLALIAGACLVTWNLGRGLSPLARLGDQADAIGSESLSKRFTIEGVPAELVPICQRLNDLLARLENAFDRERRFNSAVSHELRTPITELRSACEVALRWPAESEAALKEALDVALQMERLVETLLVLQRGETKGLTLSRESVDVPELVEQIWRLLELRAKERGIGLNCAHNGGVRIDTDRTLLRSILTNLLANAVDHSAPSSTIECEARAEAGTFRFGIINRAPSLGSDDLAHFFEPFWKKDPARTDASHAGLGLTIARAFATVLDMRIDASLEEGGRLSMTLRRPSR